MIPPLIVEEALYKGLDVIAITDHNASGNAAAVIAAAESTPLTVLPGMELQTREEVDLLCIFGDLQAAEAWQQMVDGWIPPLKNDPARFGSQYLVDGNGDFVGEESRLLQGPTTMGLEEAARLVREMGGLAVPAHIDRLSNGLIAMLGIWPPDLVADAAEVSYHLRPSEARRRFPHLPASLPLISSSDAHWLEWIGKVMTIFELDAAPTLEELRRALQGQGGRRAFVP
jgi:hypothetical protein